MIDSLIPSIEQLRAEGAVVVLKWDGERNSKRCTVVITRRDTDYSFRQDSDGISGALQTALADYRSHHAKTR
jgi:hypothetical protein